MLQKLPALLRAIHASLSRTHQPRFHFWSIVVIYTSLGFCVGIWAVLIADLANAFKLSSAQLGVALSCFPCAGIVLLVLGSLFADRLVRRHILLLGLGGLGLFFITLAAISQYWLLLITILSGGAFVSCYDLAINTLGGDYERMYTRKVMTLFNAGTSGGGALGAMSSAVALAAGMSFRTVYTAAGIVFLLLAGAALWLPFPSATAASTPKNGIAPASTEPILALGTATNAAGGFLLPSDNDAFASSSAQSLGAQVGRAEHSGRGIEVPVLALLLIPFVLLATILNCLALFTDGALEGYLSVYLRNLLGSGVLLGGAGIATLYLTGMLGRLASTLALRCYGERTVITVASTLATLGMVLALATPSALLAVAGLLLVGLGQSPIVPTAFSLTAQVDPRQSARAVAVVTACGYSVFLITSLVIGLVASLTSLRLALLLTIVTSGSIVAVAQRLPSRRNALRREET